MAQARATEAATDELTPRRRSLLDRLRNWKDQASWRVFFNTFWKFIYGVAIKQWSWRTTL